MNMRMHTRHGFTLIELSIVLVVIGLIVGGVLVGRDLIEAAQVRKMISETEKYTTAIATFRSKYNCLPGDCPNATDYFSNTGNGDGNGQINTSNNTCIDSALIYCVRVNFPSPSGGTEEVILANEHLAKANLIDLPSFNSRTDAPPQSMAGKWYVNFDTPGSGLFMVSSVEGENILRLGGNQDTPGSDFVMFYDVYNALTPSRAYAIDVKLDDGVGTTGNITYRRWIDSQSNPNSSGDLYGCLTGRWYGDYNVTGAAVPLTPNHTAPCLLSFYNRY